MSIATPMPTRIDRETSVVPPASRAQYAYLLTSKVSSGKRLSVVWVFAREGFEDQISSGTVEVANHEEASRLALADALGSPDGQLVDFLTSTSSGAILYTTSSTVRSELESISAALPGLYIDPQLPDPSLATPAQGEASRLLADMRVSAARRRDSQLHVVATDASMRRGANYAGAACIDSSGEYRTEKVHAKDSLSAELHAFNLALSTFASSYSRIHIITDCLPALRLAEATLADHKVEVHRSGLVTGELSDLLRLAEGTTVTFEWVKSHSGPDGNHLNDLADRLAVATRRSYDNDSPEAQRTQMCDRIAAEAILPPAQMSA